MAAQRAEKIGARMRERREQLGLKQREIADRVPVASVTADYVGRWERGIVEPSAAYLDLIAAALETSVADLMAGPLSERKPQGETPDPFANGHSQHIAERLDRIEAVLAELVKQAGGDGLPALPRELTQHAEAPDHSSPSPDRSTSTRAKKPPR